MGTKGTDSLERALPQPRSRGNPEFRGLAPRLRNKEKLDGEGRGTQSEGMKIPKNGFFRRVADSVWKPAAAWLGGAGIFMGVVVAEAPVRHRCGRWASEGLYAAALVLVGVLSATEVAAFVRSLWMRRFDRAFAQLLLGAFAVAVAAAGLFFSVFAAWEVAAHTPDGIPWRSTAPDAPMPFAVEYRLPSFSSEFDIRLAFASGRHTGLGWRPKGGIGDFAVYALDSGRFALVEDAHSLWPGRPPVWRIDPEAESVDVLWDGAFFALPPDTLYVRRREESGVSVWTPSGEIAIAKGVPAGDELAHRRFIGWAIAGGVPVFRPPEAGGADDPWQAWFAAAGTGPECGAGGE